MMAGIRGRDTRPEIAVRRYLHGHGLRYRLHTADLPGKPDITLRRYRTVVFVHGCFWHQHPGCIEAVRPKTNQEYWEAKLDGNVRRDKKNQEALIEQGWRVLQVWECQIEKEPFLPALQIAKELRPSEP
jgi:DNA mismatch endonuclease, patch repair protein